MRKSSLRDPPSLTTSSLPSANVSEHLLWPNANLKALSQLIGRQGSDPWAMLLQSQCSPFQRDGARQSLRSFWNQSLPHGKRWTPCSLLPTDIHGLHPGGCEPLPAALHLLTRAHSPVYKQEDWGDAPPHLCHCWQLLLQHETQQPWPVLHHQVSGSAPVWHTKLSP